MVNKILGIIPVIVTTGLVVKTLSIIDEIDKQDYRKKIKRVI